MQPQIENFRLATFRTCKNFLRGSCRERAWREAHIPGAVHLPFARNYDDPSTPRLTQPTLRDVADPADEIVFYHYFDPEFNTPWSPAKALAWGYRNVYYFIGGAPAWKAAGYPIETGE